MALSDARLQAVEFFVLARVRIELDRVEVRLNRNGTELLYAALEKIGASAEAFSDNTVMLAGTPPPVHEMKRAHACTALCFYVYVYVYVCVLSRH